MKMPSLDLPQIIARATGAGVCVACLSTAVGEAVAKPRVERVVERRIMRLETMERRMEAAAQMPPRPADVRRALRAGVPVQGFVPAPAAANAMARPAPRIPAPLSRGAVPGGPQPQPAAAVVQTSPRMVPQPSAAKPVPSPVEPPAAVSAATAVDDGTRSVLVGGEQPPAPTEAIEPIELLPLPPAK